MLYENIALFLVLYFVPKETTYIFALLKQPRRKALTFEILYGDLRSHFVLSIDET